MKVICASCGSHLKANDDLAGKSAKCPKCGNTVEIPPEHPGPDKGRIPLATERQKDYARELGLDIPPDINRRDISHLIDAAVQKQDDERYEHLDELSNQESKAWQDMRKEVLAEIDEEDSRLSVASPQQMVNELANRSRAAILVSFDRDEVVDFTHLANVQFGISFSDDMTESEMR